MIKKIFLFLSIIFLLISSTAAAVETIDLDQAVEILYNNNRQLENARKDILNAEKDLDLTGRSYFPTLNLQASTTKLDEGQVMIDFEALESEDFAGGFPLTTTPDQVYSTSLNLTQPIWLGGRVSIGREISAYALEIARAEYQKNLENQIYNLIQSYYGVLQAEGMVEIREEALDTVSEHLRIVENNYEAGISIKQDLLQTQIEKRRAEDQLNTAQNNLRIAKRRLAQIMALESNDFYLLEPELENNLLLEKDELLLLALENNSDLLILELNNKIIEKQKDLESNPYRPQVSLNANYEWQGEELFDDSSWSVTLGGSIPLYDGGEARIEGEKLEIELEKLNNSRQDLLENIDIEIEDLMLSLEQTQKQIELESLSLRNAAENLELANKSYQAGVGTNMDVIQAQSSYRQAQIALMQANNNYEIEIFNSLYQTNRLSKYFEDVILDEK